VAASFSAATVADVAMSRSSERALHSVVVCGITLLSVTVGFMSSALVRPFLILFASLSLPGEGGGPFHLAAKRLKLIYVLFYIDKLS
jgi:hypothetical protein